MRKEAAKLDLTDLLAAVPVANEAVRERRNGKTLILYTPMRRTWWMNAMAWLPGVNWRKEKGVALDALGEEVWQSVDGRRSVEAIVERFAEKHRVRFHDARLSVMTFLELLLLRNLIVVIGKKGRAGAAAPTSLENV